ncbi:MAG TPA: hypothetical protein VGL16_10200 [Actinomycetota bacterium]
MRHITAADRGADVPFAKVPTGGGPEMLSGEMARYQIGDRVREAEAERLARSTRRSKAAESRSVTRRIGRAALAAATWPIKH